MKKLHLIFFFATFLCSAIAPASPAAEKTEPLPKDVPPYGPTAPFRAPHVEVRKLGNGMTLWMVPRPGFPKVALAFAIRGGMASDPGELPGLSQLMIATLDQGTKSRNAREIANEIQSAGGDLAGSARSDVLVISTSVLAGKTDPALALLADILQNATFPDDEVALATRNASEDLRGQEADPGFLASRTLAKEMFGSHPYSVISPTQESIAKTGAADLRRAYAQRFRPDQTLLVAVGDFQPDALMAAAQKSLGGWHAPAGSAVATIHKPAGENPHAVFMVERPGSVQTTFAMASFGPVESSPDFAATQVANAIYGGMFGSRLVQNIREDKGYTYSPSAFLQTRSQAGVLQTRADVRNPVTGATLNEIDYELNRMATTTPGEDEVERARRYLVGLQAIRLQSQGSVAGQLATLWSYDLPPEELGLQSEKIQKITPQEVAAAGKKYFPASRQTIVAVGEEKDIRQQLAPFGLRIREASR